MLLKVFFLLSGWWLTIDTADGLSQMERRELFSRVNNQFQGQVKIAYEHFLSIKYLSDDKVEDRFNKHIGDLIRSGKNPQNAENTVIEIVSIGIQKANDEKNRVR